jgi:hypothetical protein
LVLGRRGLREILGFDWGINDMRREMGWGGYISEL